MVPYTRGPEYSRPFKQILKEAQHIAKNGCKEIVLLGQNVNAYNFEGLRLSNLILEIEKIPGLDRIRYTTSHPNDMTDDLIHVYKISKKLMPLSNAFLRIFLASSSDTSPQHHPICQQPRPISDTFHPKSEKFLYFIKFN